MQRNGRCLSKAGNINAIYGNYAADVLLNLRKKQQTSITVKDISYNVSY